MSNQSAQPQNQNNFEISKIYSISEAAKILRVSPATLRRWESAGVIKSQHTVGGQRRYCEDDLKFIARTKNPDELRRYFHPEDYTAAKPATLELTKPIVKTSSPVTKKLQPKFNNFLASSFIIIFIFVLFSTPRFQLLLKNLKPIIFVDSNQKSERILGDTNQNSNSGSKSQPIDKQSISPTNLPPNLFLASPLINENNMLLNSSFESGNSNLWSLVGQSTSANTKVTQESVHSGTYSIKLVDTPATDNAPLTSYGIYQPTVKTVNGRDYIFSVWVRTKGLVGSPTLRLGFFGGADRSGDPNGPVMSDAAWNEYAKDVYQDWDLKTSLIPHGSSNTDSLWTGWTRLTAEIHNAPLSKYPLIHLLNYQGGTIYIDDVSMNEMEPVIAENPMQGSNVSVTSEQVKNGLGTSGFMGNGGSLPPFSRSNLTIGDGSINVSASGSISPNTGMGGGSVGLPNARFDALYIKGFDVTDSGSTQINRGLTVNEDAKFLSNTYIGHTLSNDFVVFESKVKSDLLPYADVTYDLGSSDYRWSKIWGKDMDLSGNANVGGDLDISGTLTVSGLTITFSGDITTAGNLVVAHNLQAGSLDTDTIKFHGVTYMGDGGTTNYASFNATGDLTFYGTGDTITSNTGTLNINSDLVPVKTSGTQGWWQRNAQALSPTHIADDILTGAIATDSALIKLTGTADGSSWINTGNFGIGTTDPLATLHNAGSTLFGTHAIGNKASGGDIGNADETVDLYTSFNLTQTTAGQTITLPDPLDRTAGRLVYLSNTSTNSTSFLFYGSAVLAAQTTAAVWDGDGWNLAGGGGLLPGTIANSTLHWNSSSSQWVENTSILTRSNPTEANSIGLSVANSGAVVAGTGYGGYFAKTGGSTTNVGLYATATGATNNYAAVFDSGQIIAYNLPTATTDATYIARPTATNFTQRWLYNGAAYSDTGNMMGDVTHYKYYGSSNKFTGIYLAFSPVGAGYTLAAEYYDTDLTWKSLTLTDDTINFTINGNIHFSPPSSWTTTTVNSAGPYYWIRLKTTVKPGTTAIATSEYVLPVGYAYATYLSSVDTTPKFYVDYRGNVGVTTLLLAKDLSVSGNVTSNLIPSVNTYNLGSNTVQWNNVYATTVTASNLAGTVITGATSAVDWTIDSENAGADRDQSVIFNRGSDGTDAKIGWDATNHTFTLNAPLVMTSGIGTASIDTTAYKTNTVTRLDNAGNLTNIGSFTSAVTTAGDTTQTLIDGSLTVNGAGANVQRGLSLAVAGTGVVESGIYVNRTGTSVAGEVGADIRGFNVNATFGDGTDYLSVGSTGNLTFVSPAGASSITGPAGGTLTVAAGAAQALNLTGNATSTFSTTVGNININPTGTVELQKDTNITGNLGVNGTTSADITTTNVTAATVFNTTVATLSLGGAATTLNLGPGVDTATSVNIAGGFGATGCTVYGDTGNLSCSGNITGATEGTVGYWTRTGTTLTQVNKATDTVAFGSSDQLSINTVGTLTTTGNLSTTGSGTITSAGLLTGSLGLTVTGAAVSLNNSSNFATTINTGTSTGTVGIGNSLAGAVTIASTDNSSFAITSGDLTLSTVTSGTLALTSAGALNLSAGAASTWTLPATTVNALNIDANTLTIDTASHRVGIGVTAPTEALSVTGNETITGNIALRNTSIDAYRAINNSFSNEAANAYGLYNTLATNDKNLYGVYNDITDTKNGASWVYGTYNTISLQGTSNSGYGSYTSITASGSGNTGYGEDILLDSTNNSITETLYGVRTNLRLADSVDVGYGFHATSLTNNGFRYAFYAAVSDVNKFTNTFYSETGAGDAAFMDSVGIGVSSPQSKLDVEGGVAIGATYSGTSAAPANGLIVEGNVGIGTTNPLALLSVGSTSQFQVSTVGVVTSVGITSAGAAASLNDSSNFNTTINTGASTGTVGIGNSLAGAVTLASGAASSFTVTSNNLTLSTATSGTLALTSAGALNLTTGTSAQTFASSVATGTTSTSGFVFNANSLTTGTGMYLTSSTITEGNLFKIDASTADSLTSGNLLAVTSQMANSTFTGNLANIDWSPDGSTQIYNTGDILHINLGTYGNIGNLLNISDSASSIFTVSETATTSNIPVNFTAPGDVAIAYDINFTNPTASYIKSQAPLYLQSGETFNNSDLTLNTFGVGGVILSASNTTTTVNGTSRALQIVPTLTSATNSLAHTMYGIYTVPTVNESGTDVAVTTLYGNYTGLTKTAGTITNWFGNYIATPTGSGTVTNTYAMVTEASAGKVGIGITNPSDELVVSLSQNDNTVIDVINATNDTLATADFVAQSGTTTVAFNAYSPAYTGPGGAFGHFGGRANFGLTVGGGIDIVAGAASSDIRLYTGGVLTTDERLRILSTGSVGIGTTAPDGTLHVHTATAGTVTANAIADDLVVENSTNGGISVLVPAANLAALYFGSPTANNRSGINAYGPSHATLPDIFQLFSGGEIRLTPGGSGNVIVSTGNVGIGTTNPGTKLEVAGNATDLKVLRLYNSAWASYQSTAIEFWNGSTTYKTTYPTSRIVSQMDGSGTNGENLQFQTATAAALPGADPTTKMIINNSGNVGIGTTAPSEKLHVSDLSGATGPNIKIDGLLGDGSNYLGGLLYAIAGINVGAIKAKEHTTDAYGLEFQTYSAGLGTRMTILGGGSVGIGTTNPSALLSVGSTSQFQVSTAGAVTAVGVTTAGATASLNASSNFNTTINTGTSTGTVGIGNSLAGAITIASTANSTFTITSGDLTLSTVTSGALNLSAASASTWTLPAVVNALNIDANTLTIDATGNRIGIGMTAPTQVLDVNGRIRMATWTADGENAAYQDATTNSIALANSDRRLKKDIIPLTNTPNEALNMISQLNTYKYHDLDDVDGDKLKVGLMAQEVLPVIPELTFSYTKEGSPETYYSVHYDKLPVLLLEGIKELASSASEQQSQINSLQVAVDNPQNLVGVKMKPNADGYFVKFDEAAAITGDNVNGATFASLANTFAEQFETANGASDFNDGELLCLNDNGLAEKCGTTTLDLVRPLGAVVKHPAVVGGKATETSVPVALAGVMKVKVDAASSTIATGDMVTASDLTFGTGKKLIGAGYAVGRAMESSAGKTEVLVKLEVGYHQSTEYLAQQEIMNAGYSELMNNSSSFNSLSPDATVSGNLAVLGKTTLTDLTVTNQTIFGLIDLDGTGATINSLATPLKFQTMALDQIEFEGGKIVMGTDGSLKVEGEITAKKYNIDASNVAAASAGKAEMPIGQTEIIIPTSSLTDNSLIFATPDGSPVAVSTEKIDNTKFKIIIANSASNVLKINWWVIN